MKRWLLRPIIKILFLVLMAISTAVFFLLLALALAGAIMEDRGKLIHDASRDGIDDLIRMYDWIAAKASKSKDKP